MKPAQRGIGIGFDHIETVGGVRAAPRARRGRARAAGAPRHRPRPSPTPRPHSSLPPTRARARWSPCPPPSQRERYVKRMVAHQDHMSKIKPSVTMEGPV